MTRTVAIAAALLAVFGGCSDPGAPSGHGTNPAATPAPLAVAADDDAAPSRKPGEPFPVPPKDVYLALADAAFRWGALPGYGTPQASTPALDDAERALGMYGKVVSASRNAAGPASLTYRVFLSRARAERAFRDATDVDALLGSIPPRSTFAARELVVGDDVGGCVALHTDGQERTNVRCSFLADGKWPVVLVAELDEPYDGTWSDPPSAATRERAGVLVDAMRLHWNRTSTALAARGGSPVDAPDDDAFVASARDALVPATPTPLPSPARSACGDVVGRWNWFTGGVVTLADDTTASWDPPPASPLPSVTGRVTCDPATRRYTIAWSHGFIDDLTLGAGGDRLEGTTRQTKTAVTGTRIP